MFMVMSVLMLKVTMWFVMVVDVVVDAGDNGGDDVVNVDIVVSVRVVVDSVVVMCDCVCD